MRCVERGRTRSFTTGDCGPVAQCRGRRGAGDGDEDLHPRGHGGDDATCLWTRPSYHRDRPRPSRAAPARRCVGSVDLLTQTRVCAWARGDARGLSPSPSPGCSSRKAVAAMAMPPPSGRSRSLPRVRTAGQRTTHFVCVKVHAPAARFLCVAALGRRQAAARQLASCYPRAALRADAALGVQTELVVVGNHGLAQPAKGRRRKRTGRACEEVGREMGGRARRSVLAGEMADRHHGHCPRTPQAHWVAGKVPQAGPRVPVCSRGAGRATGASSGLFRFSDVFS